MNVVQEFENIPNVKIRRLADRYREIKTQIAVLAQEAEEIRELTVGELGLGSYDTVTVYKVAACDVSGYHRMGYRAIRARTRLGRNGVAEKS
jgi:hypothetical protein